MDDYEEGIQRMLTRRHKVYGIRLYFEQRKFSYNTRAVEKWLISNSISRERLLKVYVPVKAAGAALGIKAETVHGLVRDGKLRFPLYDYSHYGSVEHYRVWVPQSEVIRYARSRRHGGRKRST